MSEQCQWCSGFNIQHSKVPVYWELPDGTKAIEISETPTIICQDCRMSYQTDHIVKEIEDQLFLINTKNLGKQISFTELMEIPRLLKRNYFDFSNEE